MNENDQNTDVGPKETAAFNAISNAIEELEVGYQGMEMMGQNVLGTIATNFKQGRIKTINEQGDQNLAQMIERWEASFRERALDRVNESSGAAFSSVGCCLIQAERKRQVEEEGFEQRHDDRYQHGELIDAALSYVIASLNAGHPAMQRSPKEWPWDEKWWKPSPSRKSNLKKAGALIAAEIDRIDRIEKKQQEMGAAIPTEGGSC